MERQIGLLTFEAPKMKENRKILHIDMDAFFASIEQRDHPEYQGKPLIVGRDPRINHGKGVVATASYEARRFGVHSAMSTQEALKLCPDAIFVSNRHDYYEEVGRQVREIFLRYTDLVEPISIDEAFLDVTENKLGLKYATDVGRKIQRQIYEELHLTCSVGVSYNKFIAKLASDYQKPKGMTIVTPKRAKAFLEQLPIDKFYGIGKRMTQKLHDLGIYNGKDLKQLSQEECIKLFGKVGISIYERVRGVDNRPVKPRGQRKSTGHENTFFPLLYTEEEVDRQLRRLSDKVAKALEKQQLTGAVVTLKIRNGKFVTQTRQVSLLTPIKGADDIYYQAQELWAEVGRLDEGIRLLGVSVGHLRPIEFEELSLDLEPRKEEGHDRHET